MLVPFAMLECSAFNDRNRPDYVPVSRPPIDPQPGRALPGARGLSSIEPLRPPRKMRSREEEERTISIRRDVN
jgi:hypothetical protein